jgi:hypothetical protein
MSTVDIFSIQDYKSLQNLISDQNILKNKLVDNKMKLGKLKKEMEDIKKNISINFPEEYNILKLNNFKYIDFK